MTLFELVKLALDGLYDEGKAVHGSNIDNEINSRIYYLSTSYSQLNSTSRAMIDYRDPATRFAYVFKYTATHGDLVVQALKNFRNAQDAPLFGTGTSRLSCIGGGPGSDIIGVTKYLSEIPDKPEKITCYLLDGEQGWADTWTEIGDALSSDVRMNVNFQSLNVNQPKTWQNQRKFLQADLFTLSYFVSEVMAFDTGTISSFWKELFDSSKIGAKFLYLDNGHDDFNKYFDDHWEPRGDIECVYEVDNERRTPRYSEQASDLGLYREKFGQSPKLQSWISIRALIKTR